MKDYKDRNRTIAERTFKNMPQEVYHYLYSRVFHSAVNKDEILYSGVIVKWSKYTLLYVLLLAVGFSLSMSFVETLLHIKLSPVFTIIPFAFVLLLLWNLIYIRYYLFILNHDLAVIPAKRPEMYIKVPKDYLVSVLASRPFLTRGKIAIKADEKLYLDHPEMSSGKTTIRDPFFLNRGFWRDESGSIKNIQFAILQSNIADKLINRDKIRTNFQLP